ncbi:hypothetical protein PC129_g20814 [Phytophthora cactorum]|nr:hypothetical protein Pcac1_g25770 [Phytophthora cactorum]KAG2793371.1 hypothetical protein PC111_g23065 [Phytophthora cactorum]KAG2797954.1 hypothetical protein PC112_g21556 [Phytophthora cactorum]KAG2873081.1 hypothetical protein PC114_g26035 [Phytophthora cactorum]KAG2878302.1 hypothetical protein PC115_g23111 [Phytophthora cactorum]
MTYYKKISPVDVHLADDGVVQAVGTGDIVMSMKTPRGTKKGMLTSVYFQHNNGIIYAAKHRQPPCRQAV